MHVKLTSQVNKTAFLFSWNTKFRVHFRLDNYRTLNVAATTKQNRRKEFEVEGTRGCLLYTSDAADDLLCVDLGGRRIIKKKSARSVKVMN